MIHYTPQNQLSLEMFEHPFERNLDSENRWVKLAALVPWDALAEIYAAKLDAGSGRKSVNIRTVLAALIIKHKLRLDDRGTVAMIQENIYLQYFCGLKAFATDRVFDPSLFVDIRKRLGGQEFDAFNRHVIESSENIRPHQGRIKRSKGNRPDGDGPKNTNRGTLKVDATVADQEIAHPTDLKLLNASRENLERIIDLLYIRPVDGVKPRTYRRKARKQYLDSAKKKRIGKKEIRRKLKSQLQYIRRDMQIVQDLLQRPGRNKVLEKRDRKLLDTIGKVYGQQKYMYDNRARRCEKRIVNLFQPHVRPIVRGKDKGKTEFGSKINISEVDGFSRVDHLEWEAYNESGDLQIQVERFRELYGCCPKVLLADRIFLTRENRRYLDEKGIKIYGKPLGRPPKDAVKTPAQKHRDKKQAAKRNHVEGKFGQAKRGYGLNNILARLPETSESWINGIFFVMNLTKLLQVAEKHKGFSVLLFKWLEKSIKEFISLCFFQTNHRKCQMLSII